MCVRKRLDGERRWDDIESALGALDEDHDWDADPAERVRQQRRGHTRPGG